MRGYDPAAWEPFFVALISAAAALTGLLFVAVSINLDKIVKGPGFLPTRAAETLASLVLVLIGSALALVPQSVRLLGLEILILVVPMLVVTLSKQLSHRRQNPTDPLLWSVSRMACTAVATVPGTLAGLSLAVHWGGGFYWLHVPNGLRSERPPRHLRLAGRRRALHAQVARSARDVQADGRHRELMPQRPIRRPAIRPPRCARSSLTSPQARPSSPPGTTSR